MMQAIIATVVTIASTFTLTWLMGPVPCDLSDHASLGYENIDEYKMVCNDGLSFTD